MRRKRKKRITSWSLEMRKRNVISLNLVTRKRTRKKRRKRNKMAREFSWRR